MGENVKKITTRLEDKLYKRFKIYCVNKDKSMQQIITELVEKELEPKRDSEFKC